MEFDVSRPPGSRLRKLDIICTKCRVPRYEKVQDQQVYTLVLPSYLVAGGDGYSMIAQEMLKHNSGEEEKQEKEQEEVDLSSSSSSSVSWFLCSPLLQETWTCRWCRPTSPRSSRCFQPLKDASRSLAQRLDCRDLQQAWFLWFLWSLWFLYCCCSASAEAPPTDPSGLSSSFLA